MTHYAYARVSTTDQHLTPQIEQLKAAGCVDIRSEKASGAKDDRPELARLIAALQPGDSLTVCKLDRLARSTQHLLSLVDQLTARKASLRVLNFGMDTSTPTGRMMLTVLGAIAEFERTMMLERQRDGITRAQAEGKYKGRDPKAQREADRFAALTAGGMTVAAAATECGISLASAYRIRRTVAVREPQREPQPQAVREPGVWTDGELPLAQAAQ